MYRGLEQLSDDMGFISNLTVNVEKLVFHSLWNSGMHAQARVCVHMYGACDATLGHVFAYVCTRMHALGFLGLNFSKIDLFSS